MLVEGNPPQSWSWEQNGTTILGAVIIPEFVNNWRSMLQINHLKKVKLWTRILFCYRKSSWVTGVNMVYMFHRNSRGKTSQIEWIFESNLRSFGYFNYSTVIWLPLDPSCKGNTLTWVGWVLQVQFVTWSPKLGICKKWKLHSNPRYSPDC